MRWAQVQGALSTRALSSAPLAAWPSRLSQLLRDMEESYRLRLEAEVEALEKKTAAGELLV